MNEAETRAELIDPALAAAGWGVVEGSRVLRERNCQISQGRLLGSGKRAKPEIADYILVYRNRKLAVVEAKKRALSLSAGVAQALQYAGKLQTRFAFEEDALVRIAPDQIRKKGQVPKNGSLKLLDGLAEKGFSLPQLHELAKLISAENSDIFDVLVYVAYTHPPVSREERVSNRKELIFSHYTGQKQDFIDFVLNHYVSEGIGQLNLDQLGNHLELKYGGLAEATLQLGEIAAIRELFITFQSELYEEIAS